MKLLIPFVLILALLTSCGAPADALETATPDTKQELINTIVQIAQTVTAEQAEQAEINMVNLLRDQSGARTAFGDQAEAIFLKIDQDKAAALEEMVNKARGAVNNRIKVFALILKPGTSGTTNASPLGKDSYFTKSMVQAMMMIGLTTQFSNPNNENAIGNIAEGGDPVGAAGTRYSFQPSFFGSRLEAAGTITTTLTDPFPYQETIQYNLIMEACPDAQGNVPIHLVIKSSVSQSSGGLQMSVDSQVTGHTNDEGVRTSNDYNSTYQGSRQPTRGTGENSGTFNTFFESQENITVYANPENPATGTQSYTRQSSQVDEQFKHDAMQEIRLINIMLTSQALDAAEKKWTTGYCIEIQVPGLDESVQPNSITPFTATVRHKFEGVELQVPVIATLSDGQVSVSPSGSKVPAPATFSYKAPPEKDKEATINLVTRSKRGIATLDLKFNTRQASFKVDGVYWGAYHLSGTICALGQPFTLKAEQSLGGRPGVGEFVFTPTSASGGNWKYDGTMCGVEGCLTVNGSSTFILDSSGAEVPTIQVDPGSNWTVSAPVVGSIPLGGGQHLRIVETIILTPLDTNECSQP